MRGLAGCVWLLVVWAALVAGTAPGPAPAGRAGGGIPAPMPQPRCGAQGVLALPQAPPDSTPPAPTDPAYVTGRRRVLTWQIILGVFGALRGAQALLSGAAVGVAGASVAPLVIVSVGFVALALLLPTLLGRQRIRRKGERILANRARRRGIPQPIESPEAQIRAEYAHINRKFWWFVVLGGLSLLGVLAGFVGVTLFYDFLSWNSMLWLGILSIVGGALLFFISSTSAFSWTHRYRHVAPNPPLTVAQVVGFAAVMVSLLASLVLVLIPGGFVFLFGPYTLLLSTVFSFILAIITLIRAIQIRRTLRNL